MTRLIDIREASELLHVSERTIQRLVRDGELAAIRVRGSLRFLADDLHTYVCKNRTASERMGAAA